MFTSCNKMMEKCDLCYINLEIIVAARCHGLYISVHPLEYFSHKLTRVILEMVQKKSREHKFSRWKLLVDKGNQQTAASSSWLKNVWWLDHISKCTTHWDILQEAPKTVQRTETSLSNLCKSLIGSCSSNVPQVNEQINKY